MNVQRLLILIIPLLLSSCSAIGLLGGFGAKEKPIEVTSVAKERTKLNIDMPEPIKGREIEWVLITPENAEEVWAKLKESNTDLVLFGITDDGYEQLSLSMAEIRNYIAKQRAIIGKYKEYYEPNESGNATKGSSGSSN